MNKRQAGAEVRRMMIERLISEIGPGGNLYAEYVQVAETTGQDTETVDEALRSLRFRLERLLRNG